MHVTWSLTGGYLSDGNWLVREEGMHRLRGLACDQSRLRLITGGSGREEVASSGSFFKGLKLQRQQGSSLLAVNVQKCPLCEYIYITYRYCNL